MENSPPPSSEDSPPDDGQSEPKFDLNKTCRIKDISFKGVRKTRPSILAKSVACIFPARTLAEFMEKYAEVRENLKRLNAFSSIQIELDQIEPGNDENYRATFVVQERGKITASAKTSIDEQSSHLNLELSLPNLSGIGDSIRLSTKLNRRVYSGECKYSVPITPWRSIWSPIYSILYSQYEWEGQPSGIDQHDKAIVNQVDFYTLPHVQHSISFENIWRFIKSSSPGTPIEIREQCGHSVKSSLKHALTYDTRLGGNFPSDGALAKLSNEFATNLVNGGARFTRQEANLQFNTLILPKYDLLCQFNLLAGTLHRPHKISICDKFFAGGPMTLRGFQYQGLEPNVRGHPLGALSYLSAGVHLYSILPYTSPETPINEFIRPHLFFNSGTQGNIHDMGRVYSTSDIRREALRFSDSLRYSCGFGLVMYFLNLRLEVNYCLPLKFRNGDQCSRGLQWGFGLTYS